MKKVFLVILFLLGINLFFFYPLWLKGDFPFPGDLLLGEYSPWKSYSYFGYAPGAVPNKAQSFDTLRQLYPWRYLAIQAFKQGQWPLWNPFNFSGTPLLANFQTAAFYPLNFLYFIFPFNFSWVIQVVLQPFLASFFFFLFVRRLKISFPGSLLGSIAFGYSSFMTVWLEYNTIGHVILWLPLILLAVELLLESFSLARISLLIGTILFSFLAGHPQDFATVWLFTQIYLWVRVFNLKVKPSRGLKISLLSLFPFLLGAIQLLPGLELIFNSARTPLPQDFLREKVLFQPWQIILAFIPDFFGNPATRNYFLTDTYIGKVLYIGLFPLICALWAIFSQKDSKIRFFFIAAIICLFLAINSPFTGWLYSLPIFSHLSPTRISFVFQFSLAVLAGMGFDVLRKKGKQKLIPLGMVSLVFLVGLLFASGKIKLVGNDFLAHLRVVRRNLVYSAILLMGVIGLVIGWLIKFKSSFWRRGLLVVMFVLTIFDLFRFFHKITPFCPPEFIFPQAEVLSFLQTKGIGRYWGYGAADIESNYNGIYGLYSVEGYDPLYPRWYGEFVRSSEEGEIKPAVRSDAVLAHGFGRTDFAENKARQRVLQALNVDFILDRVENQTDETSFDPKDFSLIWQSHGWRIYQNKKAAPRAYLAEKIHLATETSAFEELFFQPDFSPDKEVILREEVVGEKEITPGAVVLEEYQPQRVKLATLADEDQILVLNDTFYPGWQALVDSQEVPIHQANYSFRAILVPAGEHQVEFKYKPLLFRTGLMISGLSLVGWLLAGLFSIMKKNKS